MNSPSRLLAFKMERAPDHANDHHHEHHARTPANARRISRFPSRLPNVGTTIFTVMSALAAQKGAVNLGQGFPDFACDPRIVDAVTVAMRDGHNQYPPMAGAAPLAPGDRREDRPALRPPVRRRPRNHGHGRRDAGAAHRDPLLGASGRRSHRDRADVRQLRAVDRTRGRHACVRLARSTGLRAAVRQDRRRDHAENAPPDDQHAAQSDRPRLARSRHAQARRDRARHERADRLRRSLRTHGLRRRAARERLALSGTREAQLRGVELRQDVSRDGLEDRLRGRARRAHRRVPQGASVQRLHGEHADADRPRAIIWKTRRRI